MCGARRRHARTRFQARSSMSTKSSRSLPSPLRQDPCAHLVPDLQHLWSLPSFETQHVSPVGHVPPSSQQMVLAATHLDFDGSSWLAQHLYGSGQHPSIVPQACAFGQQPTAPSGYVTQVVVSGSQQSPPQQCDGSSQHAPRSEEPAAGQQAAGEAQQPSPQQLCVVSFGQQSPAQHGSFGAHSCRQRLRLPKTTDETVLTTPLQLTPRLRRM